MSALDQNFRTAGTALDALLPRVDRRYTGARVSLWVLGLLSLLGTARSLVHLLAPDGGAGSIAHIALDVAGGPNIVAIVSQWGASQLVLAVIQWLVVLRYRFLVPLMLAVVVLEQLLRLTAGQLKPLQVATAPPGAYGTYIMLVLASVFLVLALRQRSR